MFLLNAAFVSLQSFFMSKLQVDITNKQIFKIALPISFALLVPQLNYIINNIFLGHLSEEALATASITGVYYLIFAGIGYGLNNGLQALISRRAGENKPEEIGKIFNQGILIAMIIAAVGILFTYTLAPIILQSTIKSAAIYTKAMSFLYIRIWGLPFLYIYQMRNALLVGTNQSKYLVLGTFAEAVANLFFDYTLIFGKLHFPHLGFNGAAYASILAEFIGMFVIFLVIRWKGISKRFSLFRKVSWDTHNARLITSLSGPLVFQHAISIISWFFFYILIARNTDQTSLAVSNTMRNVFGFFGVFIWAFAATTNSMVSNVIGQGKKDAVLPLIKKIVLINFSIAVAVFLLLNAFPKLYLSIYGQEGAFMETAIPVLRLITVAMMLMSVSTVWLNAVVGTGNSRISFAIEFCAITFYCIYVFIILEWLQLGIFWGWMSEMLYWSVLLSISYWYIKSNKWRKKIL
jgi:putative MATE family efflux protein